MRVITGKYKGRHFDVPRSFKARPTTDFAKENIFNVLRSYLDFEDITAIDLFSGTGSITLELLSRGCRYVVSVERDRQHFRFIQSVLREVSATNCRAVCGDALRIIGHPTTSFDLVFADPPYALAEMGEMPERVLAGNLLKPGGLFVLEHGKEHDFSGNPCFIEHRHYGSVNFSIFRKPAE
ncbi:MAG: RsmD family RNA methyltransferase [Bacteroidaceae bacterium]|nr:RsmD family RNA methyltransferase [Bacteroidaceae bacterium]